MSEATEFLAEVEELRISMGESAGVAAAFSDQLKGMSAEIRATEISTQSLQTKLSGSVKSAVDDVVLEGGKLSDALKGVGQSILNTAYNASVKPVTDQVGGFLGKGLSGILNGILPFADGGAFSQGRVMPFAKGGVFSGPVTFPMRGGNTGLMGEAGPEAIMPLTRGPDGSLGVRAQGGGGQAVNITMNVTTPDVQGFRRSQGQIAAQMSRAMQRGQRNF